MMQSSRALLWGVSCMLVGLVASDENVPELALYVPPAGLPPAAVPGPQTKFEAPPSTITAPRSPGARMPVAPATPVESPSFMMPITVDSSGAQMPVGEPLMGATPQVMQVVETSSSPFASLGGFVGGLVAGGAVVYSLLNKAGQKVSVEAENSLELGMLQGRGGVPTMMAADDTVTLTEQQQAAFGGPQTRPLTARAGNGGAPPKAAEGPKFNPALMNMPGKYSLAPEGSTRAVYDPLNLSTKWDVNWLREAELKHGRVTMLAVVGWLANDAGLKFGPSFEGISSLEAHDAMVKSGDMWALLAFVGVCELGHMSVVVPRLDGDWSGYEPGNYGLDPFKWSSDKTKEAELKHGRLAMFAFSGLATQAALGYPIFPGA